ncbi:VOC family protein [Asticcacaulis sp. EMRT-3]|uniref:VOC family protein n=1 Tax=Asticcacaulis sp. EMRT-3 TaxID=3040349 RepID=UPI0024AE9C70|nr:VOC family protein [Asticcacaulis sp. EMRT-3]MDI7773892.1 VOC family protein [Asticcacaulis sp. EMRT-3]
MTYPNTLIFVDLASDDTAAAGKFYAEVFGWTNEGRPEGMYHRLVPGENFLNKDGSQSQIGNLHLGIFDAKNARPHPLAEGVEPRELVSSGRKARIWILVSDDDSHERILKAAEERGATILWRDHYWKEFNGFNHAFEDPWGNEILLWVKTGDQPVPPEYTRE